MPKKSKEKLIAEMAYEKACEDVKRWFRLFEKGLEACVTPGNVEDLMDRVKLRDELRAEVYPDCFEEEANG